MTDRPEPRYTLAGRAYLAIRPNIPAEIVELALYYDGTFVSDLGCYEAVLGGDRQTFGMVVDEDEALAGTGWRVDRRGGATMFVRNEILFVLLRRARRR